MTILRSSGIACVLTLALFACDDDDATPIEALTLDTADGASTGSEGASTDAVDPDSAAAVADAGAAPSIRWRACGQFQDRNLECAEVEVPIDYADPDGQKLPIALRRIQADPLEPYHGALLFNPGGPGGPGIESALSYLEFGVFDAIAPGYDIVGFDPRGVANSGEVGCGIQPENMYPGATSTATPVYGIQDYVDYFEAEGARCEQAWGPLFRKLGSNNVVKDMEEIRKALQQPVLNFLGTSYGTRLGSLYAHQYPQTTGRMVLDAAVQPLSSAVQVARGQFQMVVALHEWFLAGCESAALTCPANARAVFDAALANARQRGIESSFLGTWAALFAGWNAPDLLAQALASEAADPGGEWILDFVASDDSGVGTVPFYSVDCTDDAYEPPTLAELEALRAEFTQASPLFGELFVGTAAACTGWPTTRDPVPMPTALEAPPLLVIGGTADPRTPFIWSRQMTEALGNATLLTSNHFGHGAITNGSDCVWLAVRAYLTSGSLPASGAECN